MTEQHALNWHHAELRAANHTNGDCEPWSNLPEARREEIRDRVKLVLDCEVRRSEMSPGDLAVWFGRTRLIHSEPPEQLLQYLADLWERNKKKRPDDSRLYQPYLRRRHWWDCMEFGAIVAEPRTRLFGNRNIGDSNLSNMQVAGCLASDNMSYVRAWYLSLDADPELIRPLEQMLCQSTATLHMGDMPQRNDRGIDLWREPQPVDVMVPVRQNMDVTLEFFGRAFETFRDLAASRFSVALEPFRIWVHLEGWTVY